MSYQVVVEPRYYAGTPGVPELHFLKVGENGEPARFGGEIANFRTKEEAQAVIGGLESKPYYLSHGEYGRPVYHIIEDYDYNTIYGPDCVDASDALNRDEYDLITEDEIPEAIRDALVGFDVGCIEPGDRYTIFTGWIMHDGVEYWIAYKVLNLAVEFYVDDLSWIDWDNPSFFRQRTNN